jgi:hypothetical protein
MKKKVLSELALYHGDIIMPPGWEIDYKKIASDIFTANIYDKEEVAFSKDLERLDKYVYETFQVRGHGRLSKSKPFKYHILLPNESSEIMLKADMNDSGVSSDLVCLCAVTVAPDSTNIVLNYDNNRLRDRTERLQLIQNEYIMFPTTQTFYFSKNTSQQINIFLEQEYVLA